jgi:hypothetical protein
MRILPIRSIAATSLAAVLIAGLAACGGDDEDTATTTPGTDTSAGTNTEPAAAALKAVGTGNPFEDARTAASHMPMTADALAGGIAKAAKLKGAEEVTGDAANLRAGLTFLLTEHVDLAVIAVATAYATSPTSEEFKLAAATLDKNSVAVADAVGSIVPDEKENFLQSWRSHVGNFVDYAVGAKTEGAKGKKMKDDAVKALTAYATSQGAFFNKITGGELPKGAVKDAFMEHILTLAAAVDSFAAGDGKGFDKLKTAGDHMAMSAEALTGGIAKALKYKDDPNSAASAARSTLTSQLTTHTYLAGIAVFAAYTDPKNIESAGFKAAAAALGKNTNDLTAVVKSVSTAEDAATFKQVWASHINDFVDYAAGELTSDQALKDKATAALDAYRTSAGGFFAKVTGDVIPADAVKAELKTHIETLFGAIESLKAALVKS